MVKRRYFLFLIYVAAISLVSCQDEAEPAPEEDSLIAAPAEDQLAPYMLDEAPPNDEGTEDLPLADEPTTKKPKKPKKTTEPPPQRTCPQLLTEENNDCLFNVPEGYDANSCKFNIVNAECDWECTCEAIVTEATTEEPPQTDDPDSEEPSMESCETDKRIKFKNCFIDIDGFVKRAKANPC